MADDPYRQFGAPGETKDAIGGTGPDRTLLIVDDDQTFLTRLCRSM